MVTSKNSKDRSGPQVSTPLKRCLIHDESYATICRGCRADTIAADQETA